MCGIDRLDGHIATILRHLNHGDVDQTIGATIASGGAFAEKVPSHSFPYLSLINTTYEIFSAWCCGYSGALLWYIQGVAN
jgi:hypothetical protein